MKVTILGCGGASGVPAVSAGWGKCDSSNPRNRRRRPSILAEEQGKAILFDTSPDLRDQLLESGTRRLDAVLFTHAHADHIHGIDELREVNRAMRAPISVYGTAETIDTIAERFAYVFADPPDMQPGRTIFRPWLVPHRIDSKFAIGPLEVEPFDQDHGFSRTTGYRVGSMAYSTDLMGLPEESLQRLGGLKLWVLGCLADTPHPTHAHVEQALAWVARVKPDRTVLTHMGTGLDYAKLAAMLPPGVEPGYDGMVIEL